MTTQYSTDLDEKQQQSRVDPNYSLPAPSQNIEQSPVINGTARTTSRRRRPIENDSAQTSVDNFPQPLAPDVPRAPPISYRQPYALESYGPTGNNPASFAERARLLSGDASATEASDPSFQPAPLPARRERRGSLNRPIGGVYSEIQQHKRDSYPPPNGSASPRRFSNPSSPHQYQAANPKNTAYAFSPPNTKEYNGNRRSESQTSARRASAGLISSPKREWASDRSPLQKLEVKLGDYSKEEKRARVEEAERRLRERKAHELCKGSGPELDSAVDRTSSRKTSADARPAKARKVSDPGMYVQQREIEQDHQYPQTSPGKVNLLPQSDGNVDVLQLETQPKRRQEGYLTESGQPLSRDRSGKTSAKTTGVPQPEQPERGVRFQGEDNTEDLIAYSNSSRKGDSHHHLKLSENGDELGPNQRERFRQDPSTMVSRSSSKQVPSQQQQLYSSKADPSSSHTFAGTSGDLADPVPAQAIQRHGQVPRYEIPPQTAAGVRARKRVGLGSEPQGMLEVPSHRRHHLSNLLHRGHIHERDVVDQTTTYPRKFEEWREGGTARLTAADFIIETDADSNQIPWWEHSSPESRRKSRRASNCITREAESQEGNYKHDNGKNEDSLTVQAMRTGRSPERFPNGHMIRTRRYVEEERGLESAMRAMPLPHGSHVSHFIRRLKLDQDSRLFSAYSYSCPNLADHDPSSADHICEPYLSKELMMSMRSVRVRPAPALTSFNPPLYLKCGPLLRYTGMKKDRLQMSSRSGPSSTERETWRGSVMIVTADADSTYDPAPSLRLFSEPMDLLPPPPQHVDAEKDHDLPSEYVDPIAGLPKLSRSGKTIYVKPIDDLEQEIDLSRIEDDDGLFEETRTAAVPTSYGTPDFRPGRNASTNPKPVRRESNMPKKGQQVKGVRLHAERGVTFWRFNLEVELTAQQNRIAYSINNCPPVGFWVPGRGQTMNIMFHSCNGFSMSVNPDHFSGPDPLWRDVLNSHQTRPFHVMIGGGDQIYNDAVMTQSPLFHKWLEIKNLHHKRDADFSPSMQEELETFYLERYSMWFSQGLFGMANSQIPMVNMWDDHDIIDGFGSYPHYFMSTPVFCGLGAVAFKYYMLFQHQTVPDEGPAEEPSWLMGASPGPYINVLSRSIFMSLGKNVVLLALDCRTERMNEEILSEASYDLIFERCRREILEGETKHLIVLLGVPIAYPRLVWLETLLTSKVMEPVKALGRTGMLGGFLNKFDGGVEILDDLDDHWTAKNHKQERNWFVQELQELAAEKSVRVTILGGDVHLAAIGQFYSNPKLKIPKDRDHRYMANVVSSAIVNTPPPEVMGDILNKRNRVHHLDHDTDEDMIPMFTHDVNGNPRNNKRLLPRRNWCSIREYYPGSTPPPTPPSSEPQTPSDESPSPPPTRLQRTLSLTRDDVKPGNLIRRLSGRGPPSADEYPPSNRYDSGSPPLESAPNEDYFSPQSSQSRSATAISGNKVRRHSSAPIARPGNFHRRPTNMSDRAAKKGDPENAAGQISLEQGLDVVLNCEVNQKDPAGITVPYRLLIPALSYEGHGDENTVPYRKRSLFSRLGSIRGRKGNKLAGGQGKGNWGQEESPNESEDGAGSGEEAEEQLQVAQPRRWSFGISQRRQYRDQTPPLQREHGQERPQQQRRYEDRNQQIGQAPQKPFVMPPRQQRQYGALGTQQQQFDGSNDQDRHDSIDYHQHLDSSPPLQPSNGYPGRRQSKVDKVLGFQNGQSNTNNSTGNGRNAGLSFANAQQRNSEDGYESDEFSKEPKSPARRPQGYSGIEAYSEKKGWRRFSPF